MKPVFIRSRVVTYLSILLALLLLAPAAVYAQPGAGHPLKVMTRNLYQGTDYQEITQHPEKNFFEQVDVLIADIQATKPDARMHAVAMEIAAEQPDIVALQEATTWYLGSMLTGEYGPAIDMLGMLTDDLKSIGSPYRVVVQQDGFKTGPFPSATGQLIGTNMQLVILVREELFTSGFKIEDSKSGVFESLMPMPVMDQQISVSRTWAYIDVNDKGRKFRFITAHPEAFAAGITMMQVVELLDKAAKTTLPVIMAGDFNLPVNKLPANPVNDDAKYMNATLKALTDAGFTDSWKMLYPKAPGLTCCQDNDLLNTESKVYDRIDLILTRGPVPYGAKIVGGKPSNMIEGVWPSDHAGLVGRIKVQ